MKICGEKWIRSQLKARLDEENRDISGAAHSVGFGSKTLLKLISGAETVFFQTFLVTEKVHLENFSRIKKFLYFCYWITDFGGISNTSI